MIRSLALTALLSLTTALPAMAQSPECPTGPAHDGVYMTFSDRTVLYRLLQNGNTAEMEIAFDGSFLFEYRTAPLGLILESWDILDGRVPAGDYESVSFDAGQPPLPAAGLTWSSSELSQFASGESDRFSTSVQVGEMRELVIGACRYDMLPITVNRIDADNQPMLADLMGHLPELGLTIFLGDSGTSFSQLPDPPQSISIQPPGVAATAPAAPVPAPGTGGTPTK